MTYPPPRAPDRPWAFRRGIPPAVVYRGAPGICPGFRGPTRELAIFRKKPYFAYIPLWEASTGLKQAPPGKSRLSRPPQASTGLLRPRFSPPRQIRTAREVPTDLPRPPPDPIFRPDERFST
jgi:hypothetical protein